ncbi:MAG: metal ABC transporter permease [Candidatus Izemoplasmatales bacterium]|jgi:zinc transport system permease protein|nr:metal ABC transporter permease [Candidatus Izemoplasmatales bacterium]MDD4595223.1 metal ABC transporter permease [Candidatus Izemoplasmatales bacterium]
MFLSFFSDLIEQDFMLRALISGLILGVIAPLIGSIVVIRRLSFIADTLGHFSLVGISVSLFLSVTVPGTLSVILAENPLYFGIALSVIGGLLIELFRRYYKTYKEISMVIVMSIGTALSAIFLSISGKTGTLYNYMFGSILTISWDSVIMVAVAAVLVFFLFAFFGKQIISVSFDENNAKFRGVNLGLFQIIFIIMLSIVVSVMLESAGVLLISSMMIIPIAASMKIGWSYRSTTTIAIMFSELSVIIGLWASYSFHLPSGAAIVSVNVIILVVVALLRKAIQKHNIAKHPSEPTE